MPSAFRLPPFAFPVAILAGGLATRLQPITEKIPKLLVEVAGEPFFTHQLRLLRAQGLTNIVVCLGHLGEQVVARYGDGSAHGVNLRYSFDGEKLLGTGGALRQALSLLGETFYVLYGDSYLPIDYAAVGQAFAASSAPALMTVYRNEGRFDTSNVWFEDGRIRAYDKKARRPEMKHIDYGLGILRAEVLERLPAGTVIDLADIYRDLAATGQLAGQEVHQRFYEVGSPTGLAELDRKLRASSK